MGTWRRTSSVLLRRLAENARNPMSATILAISLLYDKAVLMNAVGLTLEDVMHLLAVQGDLFRTTLARVGEEGGVRKIIRLFEKFDPSACRDRDEEAPWSRVENL